MDQEMRTLLKDTVSAVQKGSKINKTWRDLNAYFLILLNSKPLCAAVSAYGKEIPLMKIERNVLCADQEYGLAVRTFGTDRTPQKYLPVYSTGGGILGYGKPYKGLLLIPYGYPLTLKSVVAKVEAAFIAAEKDLEARVRKFKTICSKVKSS